MIEGKFRHLPVMKDGGVQGTVSMRDLMQWLFAGIDKQEGRVAVLR